MKQHHNHTAPTPEFYIAGHTTLHPMHAKGADIGFFKFTDLHVARGKCILVVHLEVLLYCLANLNELVERLAMNLFARCVLFSHEIAKGEETHFSAAWQKHNENCLNLASQDSKT